MGAGERDETTENGGDNESRPNIDEDHTAADRRRSCPVRLRGGARWLRTRGLRLRRIRLRLARWLGSWPLGSRWLGPRLCAWAWGVRRAWRVRSAWRLRRAWRRRRARRIRRAW